MPLRSAAASARGCNTERGEVRVSEHLASSDLGVIHLRRVLHRAYARGQAPAAVLPAARGAPVQLPAPTPREPGTPGTGRRPRSLDADNPFAG